MSTVDTMLEVAATVCAFTGLSHFSRPAIQMLMAVLVGVALHHAIHLCKRHLRLPRMEELAASCAAFVLYLMDALWVLLQVAPGEHGDVWRLLA